MIYYIKNNEGEFKTFDENAKSIDAEITASGDNYLFKYNGYEKTIRGYHLDLSGTENTYVKINTGGTKIRRVSGITPNIASPTIHVAKMEELKTDIVLQTMSEYTFNTSLFNPIKLGGVLDDFFSTEGGIYPGVKIMVNGEPGTMKSSNLYQLLQNAALTDPNLKVLYISGEMGALDAKRSITKWYSEAEKLVHMAFPGDYINGDNPAGITATQYIVNVLSQGWDLVVVDSLKIIQNMLRQENGFSSDDKAEQWILSLLDKHSKRADNRENKHTSFLIIQQSNRSGSIAGSATLEYMINGTIVMRVDKKEVGQQYMEFKKNRSGKRGVRLYYNADEKKGIVYNEVKYRANIELLDIMKISTANEDGEVTGNDIASMIQRASDISLGKVSDDSFAKYEEVE